MIKLIAISDTHNQHRALNLDECDILVHSGDATAQGRDNEWNDFIDWMGNQKATHKIFVAGNHDFGLQPINGILSNKAISIIEKMRLHGITYLQDSSVYIMGYNFYGSPWTPEFKNWTFMKKRGDLHEVYKSIPQNTDILITHGPPLGILDYLGLNFDSNGRYLHKPGEIAFYDKDHVGCFHLKVAVHKIRPMVHIFGNIHEGAGILEHNGIKFINASSIDGDNRMLESRAGITFMLEKR